jgi:hypothetical protein
MVLDPICVFYPLNPSLGFGSRRIRPQPDALDVEQIGFKVQVKTVKPRPTAFSFTEVSSPDGCFQQSNPVPQFQARME